MKKILLVLSIMAAGINTYAQSDGKKEALDIMRNLVNTYSSQSALNFDIAYKYFMEESPAVLLDSLYGQCKLSGDRYWYQLDNTESIKTAGMLVMIFKDDEIIYLSKPSANISAGSPLSAIDSMLIKSPGVSCEVTEESGLQSVVLNFPAHPNYKKLVFRVNKQSGYLVSVTSTVQDEQKRWAVIEAKFSNYSTGGFDNSFFDTTRYFIKQGNEYVAGVLYENFRVFLGNPGM